jgi:hypothetical protein
MKHDEEVARYRAEHGLASDDFLLVRCFIPHERRAGETAKKHSNGNCARWRRQEARCQMTGSAWLGSAEAGAQRTLLPRLLHRRGNRRTMRALVRKLSG